MTRRVTEPSQEQKSLQGRWGVEDLRKRPAPLVEGGRVEFFRAVFTTLVASPISVSGSLVDIVYTEWENSNAAVFTPLTGAGGTPTPGTHTVQRVRLLVPGRYVISWGLYFNASFTGSVGMYIHDNDPIWGRADAVVHPHFSGGLADGFLTQTIARIYPMLDPFSSGTQTPEIATDASQNSGTNRNVPEAWLEIHYEPANIPA